MGAPPPFLMQREAPYLSVFETKKSPPVWRYVLGCDPQCEVVESNSKGSFVPLQIPGLLPLSRSPGCLLTSLLLALPDLCPNFSLHLFFFPLSPSVCPPKNEGGNSLY